MNFSTAPPRARGVEEPGKRFLLNHAFLSAVDVVK